MAWRLVMWLLACAMLWGGAAAARADNVVVGSGYLESAKLTADGLTLTGWAAPEQSKAFMTNLIVRLGDREIYRGRLAGGSDRPDVVAATGRAEWLASGFQVRVRLPLGATTGRQEIAASIRLGDGTQFTLPAGPDARFVDLPDQARPALGAALAFFLGLALPLVALAAADRVARNLRWADGGARVFALAWAAALVLLVGSGTSGSSLALLLTPPAVTQQDLQPWAGEARVVRSDEWQVYTPVALAQAAHGPAFPVINRNLGPDGQNMLVMGMTAVPVAHPTALAKPATWGFFVLDGRHALAWAWWLPIWGAFGAAWLALQRMSGLAWRPAAALALALVAAPYSVAFSYWPAYLSMFLLLGLYAFDRWLRSAHWAPAAGWGALLGWSAAGFALVLYPAWQISLATLAVPLGLAWAWRERRVWRWQPGLAAGAVAALGVAGALLGSWWIDAREAVAAMQATVYPGQRASEAGGDVDRWFLLKGWLNPLTAHLDTPTMIRVDAASYQFLWLATLAAVGWRCARARRVDPLAAVLLAFAAFALTFQFIGLPSGLTRLIGWNVVTVYRLDLALGLAQCLLIGWLLAPVRTSSDAAAMPRAAALAVAVLALVQALWEFRRMPLNIADGLPGGFVLLCALAAATAAFLLLRQRRAPFLALYLGWTLATALTFHPLVQAPHGLNLAPALSAAGLADGAPDASGRRGAAVLGERNWAMTLPAAGVPVVNSLLYYPQPSLWQRLDPQGVQRHVYNRYQRLMFELRAQPSERSFHIESPRLDEVRVNLDPTRFDFRLLGARWVITPRYQAESLAGNRSLAPVTEVPASSDYALHHVLP